MERLHGRTLREVHDVRVRETDDGEIVTRGVTSEYIIGQMMQSGGPPDAYEGRILVPFPIESALSGVMRQADRLWYRRTFEVPEKWQGQRVLLHFGAVDWEATVLVNGKEIGTHRGARVHLGFEWLIEEEGPRREAGEPGNARDAFHRLSEAGVIAPRSRQTEGRHAHHHGTGRVGVCETPLSETRRRCAGAADHSMRNRRYGR